MIDRIPPVQTKRCGPTNEGATLDPFTALSETVPSRDQRDLRGRPFLSLIKAKRATPILKYPAASRRISQPRYCNHPPRDVLIQASAKSSPTSADCRSRTFRLIADFALSEGIEPGTSRIARNDTGGQQKGTGWRADVPTARAQASAGDRRLIHPVLPQDAHGATAHETRALSFARSPTKSAGRSRSSPPSSLTELPGIAMCRRVARIVQDRDTHEASRLFVLLSMNNDGSVHE
jgi:hypothetical protein